jgi:hypothetical protein
VNSTVLGNLAETGGGISGNVTIANCTVSGNSAYAGGGIFGGGSIVNSTISGNYANSYPGGGGGYGAGIELGGSLTVRNSTIAGNSADTRGGGIHVNSGTISTRNTIIAGNSAPSGPDVYGNFGSQGHNLIGNPQDATGYDPTDIAHVDAVLGTLQNNGGPTKTIALLAGSPALNAGDSTQLGVADQRGVVRSGGVNIGAYQASASAFVVTAPAPATAGTAFDVTVKAVDPFGQTALGYTGTVTFTSADPYPASLPAAYTFLATDNGTHTFSAAATLYTAGTWDVTATDTVTTSITGSAFVSVSPAAADHLLFLQQPTDTAAGQTISQVVVEVVDQFGNVVTSDNSDMVTLSLNDNPMTGAALSGTVTMTVVNGMATFSDLSIDLAGDGYTLSAATTGLASTDSAAFSITP